MPVSKVTIPTHYYQHFDADFSLDVPAEGFGGWKKTDLPLSLSHTAIVVMHAWDCGTREQFPGWHRTVEYIPRSYDICRTVFPPLLSAVRESGMKLFHVVSDHPYGQHMPGYETARQLAGDEPPQPEQIGADPVLDELNRFKRDHVSPGEHNENDIVRGQRVMSFPKEAEPKEGEGIAATSNQLFALCKQANVNHLIYAGFAINWCLLLSPGGMADMAKRGIMCSAIRQAVTAVENRETARTELAKQLGLWRVALAFGFVYDADDMIRALRV